jgi:hypothetical protein
MTTWTMCKVKYLKGLRWRSRRLFRVFQFLVRFVAKFLRIHVRLKYYKGLRVRFKQIIRIYLSSYVKLWLSQRKKRLRKIIARVVEGASASQVFLKLIQSWKNKFEFIKRVLNGAVFYKVALYRSLMQRWNKAEYEMNNESPSKSMRRHRRALTVHALKDNSGLEGVLMIPVEVKLFYLRKFIKEKMIGYIKKYRKFKIEFKNIHRRNKKNRWILENNIMFDYPSPPDKVNIYEEFDMDKMKSIIQYVVSDKSNWNHIIYGHEGRASKNYHRRISRLQPNGFI